MSNLLQQKHISELNFWRLEYDIYQKWYKGEIKELYGERIPLENEKIIDYTLPINAVLTWGKIHQQKKYLKDLMLKPNEFRHLKLLDIGSGPHPSALGYDECEIYCLDPLLLEYQNIGYPFHVYEERVKFITGYSEKMLFCDDYFDAIISVNALDHVDDFNKTTQEMKRVLKPSGKIRLHLHYHPKTPPCHPIELSDDIVLKALDWCEIFKIQESKEKYGHTLANKESYTVWSNF